LVRGDLYSLAACNGRGVIRLRELLQEFDIASLDGLAEHIITTSRDAMKKAIRSLPDGSYEHETVVDGFDEPLLFKAKLVISDDKIVVDLAGTSAESIHGINVPLPYTAAYVSYGIRCVIGSDIPNNAGSLAPIKVVAPEGCILNAVHPAPVSARGATGHMIPDLILGCLDKAIPGEVPAESASCIWGPMLYGVSNDGRFSLVSAHAGGMGASASRDGLSATAFPSGVRCTPVETTEAAAPVVIWRKLLRTDSGGAGRRRGGLGQIMEFGHINGEAFWLSAMFERVKNAACGRTGGRPGAPGKVALSSGVELNAKGKQLIPMGQTLILSIPGGGGYGEPHTRDPQEVARDIASGFVSYESAKEDYAVVLNKHLCIDEAKTLKLRQSVQFSPKAQQ
jgi:N-methylhydantoinase B